VYALRHKPSRLFFRLVQNGLRQTAVADVELKKPEGILTLPDLWTATQWVNAHLRGRAVELVELELREVRAIPSILDVSNDETSGDQLPIIGNV
jgi:hypothetical protein